MKQKKNKELEPVPEQEESSDYIPLYMVWEITGLCGMTSNETLYEDLDDAKSHAMSRMIYIHDVAKEYSEAMSRGKVLDIEPLEWDDDNLRTKQTDMCGTPVVYIETYPTHQSVVRRLHHAQHLIDEINNGKYGDHQYSDRIFQPKKIRKGDDES